jgi:hypothetical protein
MAQQKGMKRARKVAERSRKVAAKKKAANVRKTERQGEVAAKETAQSG